MIHINCEDIGSYIAIENIKYPLSNIDKSTFEELSKSFKKFIGLPRYIYIKENKNDEDPFIDFYLFPIPDIDVAIFFIHKNTMHFRSSYQCKNYFS